MLGVGIALVVFGVAREVIAGDNFRSFFDWRFPTDHGEWEKVKIGRASIVVGAAIAAVGVVLSFA